MFQDSKMMEKPLSKGVLAENRSKSHNIRHLRHQGYTSIMENPSIAAATGREVHRREIDAAETIKLSGWVTSGRGVASPNMSRNAEVIRDALGETLVEGSLNILLKRPVLFSDDTAIQMHFDKGWPRLDWPAKLNGVDVWINRWQAAPLHIAELLSAVHLRKHLHLSDGDEVQIEVRKCDVKPISKVGLLTWTLFWFGRKNRSYRHDSNCERAHRWGREFGATQLGTEKNCGDLSMALSKGMIKKIPGARSLRSRLRRRRAARKNTRPPYRFERVPLDTDCAASDRAFTQVRNLLNYTKTSGAIYSAQDYPAGYHTIEINGRRLQGQRQPSERLKPLPVDFTGKSVLDIGCNQGGMLFKLPKLKWGVGVDYDARMVNAANRIKALREISNLNFYVLDLEKEPLDLIEDFMPEPKVDVVFLLAVCKWISNWREVIAYGAKISSGMLFETTGPAEQQEMQIAYLKELYSDMQLIAERSEDDPGQKRRKLFYCCASNSSR